jgi:hypothetical protein
MKKPKDNKDLTNSNLDSNSDNNVGDIINERGDEFVLFPLDVQDTNKIIQNTITSQDDEFILFPLDVKKTSTNTNNPAPITNQKPNKPKSQFVTKPNSQPANPNKPSPVLVNRPTNKKLRNIFWFVLICLCLYTYNKKDSNESYIHFLSKTRDKIGNTFNYLKLDFSNEEDFIKFKKGKKIIYCTNLNKYIEDDSKIINEVKGDSIIIIEPTGNYKYKYYIDSNSTYGFFDENIQYEKYVKSNRRIYLAISDGFYESWSPGYWYDVECENFEKKTIYITNKEIEKIECIELKILKNKITDFENNLFLFVYIPKDLYVQIKQDKIKSIEEIF